MAAKKKRVTTPSKDKMFLEMLEEGISKGNWEMVTFAYKMKTGKELIVPKTQQTQSIPTQPSIQANSNLFTNTPRIQTVRENKFFDDGKTTRIGDKIIDSCQKDIEIDKKLKNDSFEKPYRDDYQEVEVQCEMPNCSTRFLVPKNVYMENNSPANRDGADKINLLVCPKCGGG